MSADLWVCPDCAFAFAAEHTDADGGHTCPACNEAKLTAELERLRAERDALRNVVRYWHDHALSRVPPALWPMTDWTDGDWAESGWTPAEADAIRHAIETDR